MILKNDTKSSMLLDESVLYYGCKQNIGGYQHEKSIDFTNEICSREDELLNLGYFVSTFGKSVTNCKSC